MRNLHLVPPPQPLDNLEAINFASYCRTLNDSALFWLWKKHKEDNNPFAKVVEKEIENRKVTVQ